jgi:hypothetical protein
MASPFEQGDLWGALGSDDDDGTQKKEISVFTGNKLAELSPSEMEIYDRQIRIMIYNETDELKKSLGFCDRITIAAYKVADYVPDLSNNKYSPFWKEQVSVISDEILRFRTLSFQLFGQDRDGTGTGDRTVLSDLLSPVPVVKNWDWFHVWDKIL